MYRKIRKIQVVLLLSLVLSLSVYGMFSGSVYSSHPMVKMVKRSAPITVSLSLSGISSIGQEGEVVFSVSSTEWAPNTEAKILLPEGFSKVAGDLSWTGDIVAGQTIEIRAKVKAEKVGDWTIEGQAISKMNGSTFGKSSCLHVSISQNAVTINDVDPVTGTNEESICLLDEQAQPSGESGVAPMSPGTVTVYGWWYFYEEDNATLRPIRHVKVELWDSDLGGLINYLLATTYTDDNGYYQFPPINNDDGFLEDGLDVFVKEYSDNSIVKVIDDAENLYWGQTGVDSNVPDGWHNMGSWAVTGDNRGNKAILDTIEIGHEYASSLGYNHVKVEVRWPSDGTYVPSDDPLTIRLLSGDEWDEDVILHEYGHTIQHSIYGEWIPNAGGSHTWNQHTNPNFAFSEGWSTFFAVAANFEMGYGDSLYPRDSWYRDHVDQIINHELETDNHAYGVDVEGAVACLLWDIYDSSEDVLAHGTDSLSAGMPPIWDVFANYLTGGHHVYNIYLEFWNGWFDRGHDYYQGMWDIYYHHCLLPSPVCAMKTKADGYFYVPYVATDVLKIEMLFDNQNITGDQTGGISPYDTIQHYPDGLGKINDIVWVQSKFGTKEGDDDWDYMADINADRRITIADIVIAGNCFGHMYTYLKDLSGVTVTFNTGGELSPDSYGFVVIPSGATSFTVKRNGNPIGAMVIFW